MSTLPELIELTTVADEDLVLVRNVDVSEDSHVTKENFLKEKTQDITNLQNSLQTTTQGYQDLNTYTRDKLDLELVMAGDDLVLNSELQSTQNNPFPLANSVPPNTELFITVSEPYRGITTTHTPSGTDTTSGTGDGFIINWGNSGTVKFISNGVDNWRKV